MDKMTEELAVYYSLTTVAVHPKWAKRNTNANCVVGPFPKTNANIRYCTAIVDAANKELEFTAVMERAAA